MKKLLLLPLLLLSFMVKAQLPVLRGPDGVTVEDTRLYILKNFRVPVFEDSTAANTAKGLDSLGTLFNKRGTRWIFIRTPDANGTHKWDTLGGSGSGGGATGDTVYLYQIGTAAGQIETLYAVDGNLRKSRWVPGYGTLPFLAADSAAYIDIDTTSIAYKSWVIQQFGTSVNNLQQVIDNGHQLTRNDTITGSDLYSLEFDSLSEFAIKDHSGNALFDMFPSVQTTIIQGFNALNNGVAVLSVTGLDSTIDFSSINGLSIQNQSSAAFSLRQRADQTTTNTLYWPKLDGGTSVADTLATLRDVRTGGGGGGGSSTTFQQAIDNSNILTKNDTISGSLLHSFEFDSLTYFSIMDSVDNHIFDVYPSVSTTIIQAINTSGDHVATFTVEDSLITITANNGISIGNGSGSIPSFSLQQQAAAANSNILYWPNQPAANDTIATIRDLRSGGVGRDTVQAYTSGTTLTQSASTNYIQVNPASVQATLTITTLASGGTWHTSNDLYIVFGGTVTSGAVITSITITAGSGMTLIQNASPDGLTYNAGDIIHYHKVGSFLYRVNM